MKTEGTEQSIENAKKMVKENFGDNVPVECPSCKADFKSIQSNKKVWHDKKTNTMKAGLEITTTIHYWCGASFTIGNGCSS